MSVMLSSSHWFWPQAVCPLLSFVQSPSTRILKDPLKSPSGSMYNSLCKHWVHSKPQVNVYYAIIYFFSVGLLNFHCLGSGNASTPLNSIHCNTCRSFVLLHSVVLDLLLGLIVGRNISASLNWNQHHQRHENGQTCYFAHANA